MTVPYGPKYQASRINRLLYAKDLLLNAEWNQPKEREVYLHRHPCFFGTAEEVLQDCCGYCPVPKTDEEIEVAEEESKTYISGPLKFLMDDPGRQEIGSFNPITDEEWTTMAYVGDTARLCQAIVDGDLEHVQDCMYLGSLCFLYLNVSKNFGDTICLLLKSLLVWRLLTFLSPRVRPRRCRCQQT